MNKPRNEKPTRRRRQRISIWRSGLTLIEVLVVIVILALLASVLAVNYRGTLGGAKQKITKQEILKLKDLLEQYYLDMGNYPDQSQGLDVLTKPLPGRNEALLSHSPRDPWGHPYQYVFPGNHGPYDIISYGADGVEGGTGENADVVSWDTQGPENTAPSE